ncbi:MAG: hypothetical protein JNK05_39110 [Myxococcales bacterium]|nr:hypothetical protein [Myxococcales bacterium]
MLLYRPVGLEELLLIFDAKARAYPPRLPDQPIFYPVLTRDYAAQIAREWNTKSGTLAGYVTRFSIDDGYARTFEPQTVGSSAHRELWVPAEELDAFNARLEGPIEVIDAFFGAGFAGVIPSEGALAGCDATAQLAKLSALASEDHRAFERAIVANARTVYAHYGFWQSTDGRGLAEATRDELLANVASVWRAHTEHARVPLAARER